MLIDSLIRIDDADAAAGAAMVAPRKPMPAAATAGGVKSVKSAGWLMETTAINARDQRRAGVTPVPVHEETTGRHEQT